MTSNAGTNLKVGEAPARSESEGAPKAYKAPEIFFGRSPPLFWLLKYN